MGFELVDLQVSNRGRFLRVFMDKPGGITVDDCAAVSRHLSRVLEVDGIDYDRLEVSSPGLDRPLRDASDYQRFAGRLAKIVVREPVDNQKAFEGRLLGLDQDDVLLEAPHGRTHRLPLRLITRGRLEVEF